MGQIVAFNAVNISIRWGRFRDITPIRTAIALSVRNAAIKAVADVIFKMQEVVPERTGRLINAGIQVLTNSLSIALTRKNRFTLKIGWPVFYATFVELFPKETTDWTKKTSDPDYRRISYRTLTDKFQGYLFQEIARQNAVNKQDFDQLINTSDLGAGTRFA